MNKKWINSLLACAMTFSSLTFTNVHAATTAIDHLGRNATATASNDDGGQTPASRAFDGLFGNRNRWGTTTWSNLKQGHYVQADFGSEVKTVKDFKITFENRSDVAGGTNIVKYHIEAKKEGQTTFETIYTSQGTIKVVEEISLAEAQKVTAVKLVIDEIKHSNYNNCNVEEFEIYGDRSIESAKGVNHALASNGTTIEVSSTEHPDLHKGHLNDGVQTNVPANDGERNMNRWGSANATPTITLNFKKTTQVQEVFVNFWRNCKPFYNQIEAFDIVYTDETGTKQPAITVRNTLVDSFTGANQGYQDTVTYVFEKPVNMQSMQLTNFKTKSCDYNTPSIEEIEVYSNKRETVPPTVEVEERLDRNHLVDARMEVSSTETNDDRFTAVKLNNGVAKTEANNKSDRWSARGSNEWATAKFAKATKIQEVDFYLFTRDADPMPSNIKSFNLKFTKLDGSIHTVKVDNTRKNGGWSDYIQVQLPEAIVATDMRIDGFMVDGTSYPNVSINEIEVYTNKQPIVHNLSTVTSSIQGGVVEKGTTTLVKPEMPEGYTVEFNGCDLEQIIDSNLNIHTPLVDKVVNVNWNVTETATGNKANTGDLQYTIKGVNESSVANTKPVVIPEIQEWYAKDTTTLKENTLTTVVYNDESLKTIVDEFVKDYKEFTGHQLTAKFGTSYQAHAIYFEKTNEVDYLGNEGYTMDIKADGIVVKSNHVTGNMYGMQTILQMIKQNASTFPVGSMHDYPRYQVRGFVFDVARKPVSMSMLKDVARSMRYYKMNDFQVHLNDNYIFLEHYFDTNNPGDAYEAFRLESNLTNDQGVSPTAKDYHYKKAELKDFITTQRALGMNIVPEIDVPAHSLSFTKVWEELSLNGKFNPRIGRRSLFDHWDLTNPKAIDKIKEIFDEYTSKGDNVFDKDTIIHIGADEFEYNATAYRNFVNIIIPYLKQTNNVRIWGGLTWINDGHTQIIDEAVKGVQINLWSKDWSDGIDMYNMGYDLINTIDCYGYMVPNGNLNQSGYYPDLLKKNDLFNNFEVNKVRRRGGEFAPVPSGDDQMDGAAFAIWNDNIDKSSVGLTESDEFYRFFDAMPVYAEKTWAATGREKQNATNITNIANQKGTGPNTNPYYLEEADKNGDHMKYDFASHEDLSLNNRDLTLGGTAKIENGALVLNGGESYATTPLKQLGNGNTLSFDITLNKAYKAGDIIFEESSAYGTHDLRIMKDGRLGFTRELHDYYFNYRLPVGQTVNIKIVTERQATKLYVNDVLVGKATGEFTFNGDLKKTGINNSTFALPLERIGSTTQSINATIDNVNVYTSKEIVQPPVVDVLDKAHWQGNAETQTTHSATEGEFAKAFDNNYGTIWHSNWKGAQDKVPTATQNGQGAGADGTIWGEITFPKAIRTNNFSFTPRTDTGSGRVTEASLFIKNANGEWVQVANHQTFAADGSKKTFFFDTTDVYGIRFEAHKSNDGWVTVSEFDCIPVSETVKLIIGENAMGTVTVSPESQENTFGYGEKVTVEATAKPGYKFVKWINSITGETLTQEAAYTFRLTQENNCIEPVYEVDPDYVDYSGLKAAIEAGDAIDPSKYTEETVKVLEDALTKGQQIVDALNASQKEVNDATDAINKAIAELKVKPEVETNPVNKAELEALIKKALEYKAEGYTKESFEALQDAIISANAVVGDEKATQDQVDAMVKTLQAAIDGLKVVENTQQPTTPPTGDTTKIGTFVATLGLAAAGIYVSMKKKKDEE